MLQEDRTKQEYGYDVESLTKGSSKKVCLKCDYCNIDFFTSYKLYLKGHEVILKDACKKCRYDKRRDVSLAKYGVANSAQRQDVRDKMSKNCAFNQKGFKAKSDKTMMEKYGTTNAMQSEELRQKQKQTVVDKYGVENVSQVKEFRDKVDNRRLVINGKGKPKLWL